MNPSDYLYDSCIIKCFAQAFHFFFQIRGEKLVKSNFLYVIHDDEAHFHVYQIHVLHKKEESSLKWFICSISAKSKTEIDLKRERLVQKTT